LALLTEGVQLFTRIIKRHMVKNADTNGMWDECFPNTEDNDESLHIYARI
jgi:hypothetical protein